MIILLEDRVSVADSYRLKFLKGGRETKSLSTPELATCLQTPEIFKLLAPEAVLVGDCLLPLSSIKLIQKTCEIPVIAILESRSLERLIELYQHGVDDVVVEPVHIDELIIRIAAITKRIVDAQIQDVNSPLPVEIVLPVINCVNGKAL